MKRHENGPQNQVRVPSRPVLRINVRAILYGLIVSLLLCHALLWVWTDRRRKARLERDPLLERALLSDERDAIFQALMCVSPEYDAPQSLSTFNKESLADCKALGRRAVSRFRRLSKPERAQLEQRYRGLGDIFSPAHPSLESSCYFASIDNLTRIVAALSLYEEEHGSLPYDSRGWEYGLYKLQGYLSSEEFDLSYVDDGTSATFDSETRMLIGSDYVYINSPMHRKIDIDDASTPLVWERDHLREESRLVCRLDLDIVFLQPASDFENLECAPSILSKPLDPREYLRRQRAGL